MKRMLKILAFLMEISMILGVICSCGGGSETSEIKPESSTDSAPSTDSTSESVSESADYMCSCGCGGSVGGHYYESESIDTTPSIEVDTDGVDTDGVWNDEVE